MLKRLLAIVVAAAVMVGLLLWSQHRAGPLHVSGIIEAFVTPSGLPTAARIGIGVLAELLFLAWVFGPGRRAVLAGRTGDLVSDLRGETAPSSA